MENAHQEVLVEGDVVDLSSLRADGRLYLGTYSIDRVEVDGFFGREIGDIYSSGTFYRYSAFHDRLRCLNGASGNRLLVERRKGYRALSEQLERAAIADIGLSEAFVEGNLECIEGLRECLKKEKKKLDALLRAYQASP